MVTSPAKLVIEMGDLDHSQDDESHPRLRCLWGNLNEALDSRAQDWKGHIEIHDRVDIDHLLGDEALTDSVIFEALALALVSGNTRWERIARIRSELAEPFLDFNPRRFATLSDTAIETQVLPWFRHRKAGSANLRASLLRLKATAVKLSGGPPKSAARSYLRAAWADGNGTPEALALALGTSEKWKLPGFGIALAAEALRNLGLDLCKPDRHIQRAIGSWSLVSFRNWERRGPFTSPQSSKSELLATMFAVRSIAEANRITVNYANSVIWYAGAVSGARMTNTDLAGLSYLCP